MSSKFYIDNAFEAAKKITARQETILKKDGTMTKVRRHHMSPEDQVKYKDQSDEQGRFVSPYRRGGGYWGIVETLSQLGENEEHAFGVFWDKFMEIMSDEELPKKHGKTPWQTFSERPRRAASGKSVIEKMHQNIRVLQRLGGNNPYGMKLAQLNSCIDVLGTTAKSSIRLRTSIPQGIEIVPLKETSRACPTTCSIKSGFSVDAGNPKAKSMSSMVKDVESAIDSNTQEVQEESKIPSIFVDD